MDANENHPLNRNEVQQNRHRAKTSTPIPIILILILIPILMLLWLGNTALVVVPTKHNETIPLTRWLVAVLFPCFISYWSVKKRKLNLSGAVMGFFVGSVITLSSYIFSMCLITFFIAGNIATHFQSDFKCCFQEKHKQGGQRGWRQVICNSAMAVQVALLYILDTGSGERPIDFRDDYRESWFGLAVLGTIACCSGDTWASELGIAVSSESPHLITTFRKVPRGTNGGVSLPGLLFSFLGGLFIGLAYYITLICTVDSLVLHQSPPQWPVILWGGFAGFVGSLFDSFFGATLQYTGLDKKTGTVIVERPRKDVQHINGLHILDNHGVNLISHIITGFLTPYLASILWP